MEEKQPMITHSSDHRRGGENDVDSGVPHESRVNGSMRQCHEGVEERTLLLQHGHGRHQQQQQQQGQQQFIVLFYKYHPLSSDPSVVDVYRTALERLCRSLHLKGRVLVGCNEHRSEGINGTLSGNYVQLNLFVRALQGVMEKSLSPSGGNDYDNTELEDDTFDSGMNTATSSDTQTKAGKILTLTDSDTILGDFWTACDDFYRQADCPPLTMEASEFKWSQASSSYQPASSAVSSPGSSDGTACCRTDVTTNLSSSSSSSSSSPLFPDLNIKIVKELIGTGGVLASIPLDEVHQGYLTPQEWHERVLAYNNNEKNQIRRPQSADGEGTSDGSSSNNNNDNDTILIDCRNTKECQIGHFMGAVDPQTTTFNQFTQWVDDHRQSLASKKTILMYCTGGIRCEKASAYIRRHVPSVQEVRHLKGGIHKYLEEFGGGGGGTVGSGSCNGNNNNNNNNTNRSMWRGKNFVFDGRGAHGPTPTPSSSSSSSKLPCGAQDCDPVAATKRDPAEDDTNCNVSVNNFNDNDSIVVGSCRYCNDPYDSFDPHCVCTVCREPTLVCWSCQQNSEYREYHCKTHQHLQECYFTNLEPYSAQILQQQLHALQRVMEDIAVGKKYKQRRKTLSKQCEKIVLRLEQLDATEIHLKTDSGVETDNTRSCSTLEWKCRNCGEVGCSGKCWGFHGLKRKRVLESRKQKEQIKQNSGVALSIGNNSKKYNQHNSQRKETKELQKQEEIQEWIRLGLTQPPSVGRNPITGLRVPAPCTRKLETKTKGKWCGQSLLKVLQIEFADLAKTAETLPNLLRRGLIRVNGKAVLSMEDAESLRLKNMDVISRVVHWHEPPIYLPQDCIRVQEIAIPNEMFGGNDNGNSTNEIIEHKIYVCDKPSTVPVHPAGPYLSNTLTLMVEAQEGLTPRSLIPCHRIDRATSGMTLCCTNVQVARLIQTTIDQGRVRKQYLAKVHGRFPADPATDAIAASALPTHTEIAKWQWIARDGDGDGDVNGVMMLQVDAPIETVDPANGLRKITSDGKVSTSRFELVEYDEASNTSILRCIPVTGRSHQLRVHLQWLGHPIIQDIKYGGAAFGNGGSDGSPVPSLYNDSTAGIRCIQESIHQSAEASSSTIFPILDEKADAAAFSNAVTVSTVDVDRAREVCVTCQAGGPSAAFTPAQLLQGGHAICLHAHRYSLFFFSNDGAASKRNDTNKMDPLMREELVRVDLQVDLPPWADHLGDAKTKRQR